jgi:hypothetical protein
MFNRDLIKLMEKIKYDTLIKPILSQLNIIKNRLNKFQFIEVSKFKLKLLNFIIILFYINFNCLF